MMSRRRSASHRRGPTQPGHVSTRRRDRSDRCAVSSTRSRPLWFALVHSPDPGLATSCPHSGTSIRSDCMESPRSTLLPAVDPPCVIISRALGLIKRTAWCATLALQLDSMTARLPPRCTRGLLPGFALRSRPRATAATPQVRCPAPADPAIPFPRRGTASFGPSDPVTNERCWTRGLHHRASCARTCSRRLSTSRGSPAVHCPADHSLALVAYLRLSLRPLDPVALRCNGWIGLKYGHPTLLLVLRSADALDTASVCQRLPERGTSERYRPSFRRRQPTGPHPDSIAPSRRP